MFQARFVKVDEFGWWDLERISADHVRSLPRHNSRKNTNPVVFGLH